MSWQVSEISPQLTLQPTRNRRALRIKPKAKVLSRSVARGTHRCHGLASMIQYSRGLETQWSRVPEYRDVCHTTKRARRFEHWAAGFMRKVIFNNESRHLLPTAVKLLLFSEEGPSRLSRVTDNFNRNMIVCFEVALANLTSLLTLGSANEEIIAGFRRGGQLLEPGERWGQMLP